MKTPNWLNEDETLLQHLAVDNSKKPIQALVNIIHSQEFTPLQRIYAFVLLERLCDSINKPELAISLIKGRGEK